MANYRSLHTRIWSDPDNEDLSAEALLLFAYLITNPHRNESALYRRSIAQMGTETRLGEKRAAAALAELVSAGRVFYDAATRTVWVKNAVRYQTINPNCIKAIINDLQFCSSPELVKKFYEYYRDYEPLYEPTHELWKRFVDHYQTITNGFANPPNRLQGTGNVQGEGGVGGEGAGDPPEEPPIPPAPSERGLKRQAEEIYDSYPVGFKVGKPDALRAIRKAMRTTAATVLLERTRAYAEAVQRSGYEYVPNPATWFNQERYNDEPESWIRHRNGSSGGNPGPPGPPLPHGLMTYAAIMDEHRKDATYQGRCEFYTLVATDETVGRLRRPDAEAIPPDYAKPITTAANGAQVPAASANTATNTAAANAVTAG